MSLRCYSDRRHLRFSFYNNNNNNNNDYYNNNNNNNNNNINNNCSAIVDKTSLHGHSCKKSAPRHIRHAELNDIIWRAVKRAQYPSVKEPMFLLRSDGKRPDGATLIPWTRGKPLAWNITVADMYANLYFDNTATREVAAADRAASSQVHRAFQDHLTPIAIETGGSWNYLAIEFHQRVREKDHSCDTRATINAIPISDVCRIAERKCGCVSEHFSSRALILRQAQVIP